MRENEWWTGTARHMWRAYFAMIRNGTRDRSDVSRKIFSACDDIFQHLTGQEQSLIRAYYDCQRTPGQDGFQQIARTQNVRIEIVASTIRAANKRVIENVALLETDGGERT